jgi:hypothetical protein
MRISLLPTNILSLATVVPQSQAGDIQLAWIESIAPK